jgi:serine/threonine protein kinase
VTQTQAFDLLSCLLKYDHSERATAAEALAHPYFHPVRHLLDGGSAGAAPPAATTGTDLPSTSTGSASTGAPAAPVAMVAAGLHQ